MLLQFEQPPGRLRHGRTGPLAGSLLLACGQLATIAASSFLPMTLAQGLISPAGAWRKARDSPMKAAGGAVLM